MTTTYIFNKSNRFSIMSIQHQSISIIKSFFAKHNSLVGKQMFTVTPDKTIIQIFYYMPNNTLSDNDIITLSNALTLCWNRPIELRLVRINYSILDSSIFDQYLAFNSNIYSSSRLFKMIKKNLPFVVSQDSVSINSIDTVSHITGVDIRLSGRLATQRSAPRKTLRTIRLGSSAKGIHGMDDYSKYTSKNKLGAFTMKVWISQQSN
jgi:hypothetical protein